jgi:acetylornithine/N-succinyldiaminopimelate aminotransferase
MIAATGNPAVNAGFDPAVPGFVQVEGGDFDALAAAIDDETAGVLMEPIQGEGGVNVYPEGYAARVRKLCSDKNLVLIFDEVWTGCGRTGRWFGHQHFADESGSTGSPGSAVTPDIMTLGKAVGGGLPVGVMWARPALADLLVPGKHGSTLGGNNLAMAAARAIFDIIERENLLGNAQVLGEHAIARLRNESSIRQKVSGIRGRGLFLGIELKDVPEKLVERGLERGILVNVTAQKVIRLAPPINITAAEWEKGLDELVALIASL